jgi:hypothetical protein
MLVADDTAIKVSQMILSKNMPVILVRAQEVTTSRARFPKPVEQYRPLIFFGHNIIASEGEEWKKYRKISAPAFSDVSLPCWSKSWNKYLDLICIFSATTS